MSMIVTSRLTRELLFRMILTKIDCCEHQGNRGKKIHIRSLTQPYSYINPIDINLMMRIRVIDDSETQNMRIITIIIAGNAEYAP